jgi:AcrR family transcriptional regulator
VATKPETGKRQAMLNAALTLFLEHGVVDTTVDQILQLSGASVGSLYHHFGGKEQLADGLYTECLAAYQEVALDGLHASESAEEGVRFLVHHHLTWIEAHRPQSQFILSYRDHEIRPAAESLRALNTNFYTELERWIVSHASHAVPLLPAVISQWIGPMHMYARHWLTSTVKANPADVAPFLADAAWYSLQPLLTTAPKG